MALKFGLFVPQGWKMDLAEIDDPVAQFEAMTAVAKAADAEPNWHSIWLYDHFHTVPTPEIETTFECWTTTATLARDTKRVRIGQMTGCNGYPQPRPLRQDRIHRRRRQSRGRLDAGLGAGWYEHEWEAYGYGFPETPERMRQVQRGRPNHPQNVDRGETRLPGQALRRSTVRSTNRKARSARPEIRCGSAAAARKSPSNSSPSTATPATSAANPTVSGTNSTSYSATATHSAATTTRSSNRPKPTSSSCDEGDRPRRRPQPRRPSPGLRLRQP